MVSGDMKGSCNERTLVKVENGLRVLAGWMGGQAAGDVAGLPVHACVYACGCACVHVCVCLYVVCVCVCVCVCVRTSVCVCVLACLHVGRCKCEVELGGL